MKGDRHDTAWTPDAGLPRRGRGPAAGKGPRWTTSLRALVVVLAMATAAAGVLWLEQAGVSEAAGQLTSQEPAKVAVPPLGGAAATNAGPPGNGDPGGGPGAGPGAGVQGTAGSGAAGPQTAAPAPGAAGTGAAGEGPVTVHVAGAVKHPGVYTLPAGSRILQAVESAGGALPAAVLDALNLAALAADGTQIMVPTQAQLAAGTAGSGGSGSGAGGAGGGVPGAGGAGLPQPGSQGALVNLNTATAEQLDALPGVGPVLAGRIVAWRSDHGPFTSVDELDAVSGIGAKMLANIRPLVSVQ